jgi:predicted Zn-dependent protease
VDRLAAEDPVAVERGRRLVERGVALDETGLLGRADLARLELSQGQAAAAVAHLRKGLRCNPSQPVLQGLWGYSALAAQTSLNEPAAARRLLTSLEEVVDTPDGWYWISRTLAARGDPAGAEDARARAKEMAPHLGSWKYRQRLLQSR